MPRRRTEPDPFDPLDLLERGSREHYDDPVYYDHTYRRRRDDVTFYRAVARRWGSPILELGVGSGRVALPLCRDGHNVVGVDASRPMLDRARALALAADLPRARLTLREGDMRDVRLRRRFPLVIAPFNALMHLYEPADVVRCFANVARHLTPDGRFVFDVRMPNLRELLLDPEREYKCRPFTHPTLGRVQYTEQFRYDPVKQVQFVTMRFYPAQGKMRATVLAHRQFFPAELRALLSAGGLRLTRRMGDASGRPLAPEDSVQFIEAARA